MNRMKKILLILLLFVAFTSSYAQQTLIYTHSDRLFEQGKELFDQQKYTASYRSFEEFLNSTDKIRAGQRHEAEYYLVANAFELRQQHTFSLIQHFLTSNPYTPFIDKLYAMLGILLYEEDQFENALSYFNKVNEKRLNRGEKLNFQFCKAYTLLRTGSYHEALALFKDLKGEKFQRQEDARYYYAYTEYALQNYSAALPEFLGLEDSEVYKEKVAFYLFQIYYFLGIRNEMNERYEFITTHYPNHPDNAEIYRIKGEVAYAEGQYEDAINYLKRYESLSPQMLRNDLYMLGIAHIRLNRHYSSIPYFQRVTTEPDAMTENAYLHLGNAYIRANDKENARLAFEAALRTNFDKQVREEALLNYALTTYETTSAFGESISALEQFLEEFPNSKDADKVKNYLAMEYMATKNYEVAYQSIQKVARPNEKILEAKQYILYQLGTEAFARQDFNKAVDYFTLSIQNLPVGIYAPESYYWRSESFYRLGMHENSIDDLNAFFRLPDAKRSNNYVPAHYGMGYAYFSRKNFRLAKEYFERYTTLERNKKSDIFADALNRIGDCYFYDRDFRNAELIYTRSANLSPNTGDYALFQSGYVAGLQKKYSTKISRLNDLVKNYPKSEFADDALYEIGRAYIMLGNDAEALNTYRRLLSLLPNSNMARSAAYEIGMIYQNQEKYPEAIKAYKAVIADYPGSVEAFTALQSLEGIYIEMNDVPAYLAYVNSLDMKSSRISVSHEDSISYIAAEKQYMNSSYRQAITGFRTYLNNYCPGGKYCTAAQFYIADSYYRLEDYEHALSEYQQLTMIQGNQYMEEALTRSAEITYDQKRYGAALEYFEELIQAAQSSERKNTARLGVLRSSYQLKDYQKIISVVSDIVSDSKSGPEVLNEARYYRAKAYIATKELDLALEDLKWLATDTRTAIGAESKYLTAQVYFMEWKLDESEKEILDFAKKNTPFQYWLARSFVLLSDIYQSKQQDFQAKQYLLSLQRNYKVDDDIQEMITTRLDAISRREKSKVIN
ncbi:MAG TPA: tetratricopeptide repeat protein [Paludibacter sp.]|nr:tetratricopeptide repeat protein [Paludibacter sp.]